MVHNFEGPKLNSPFDGDEGNFEILNEIFFIGDSDSDGKREFFGVFFSKRFFSIRDKRCYNKNPNVQLLQ